MGSSAKQRDLKGYHLLIVGSKDCSLDKLFSTLRICWNPKEGAKANAWKKLGMLLKLRPNIITERDTDVKSSKSLYEVITKWCNLKREQDQKSEVNLRAVICFLRKAGFPLIAKGIQDAYQNEVKRALENRYKQTSINTDQNLDANLITWNVVGEIRYNESKPLRLGSDACIYKGKLGKKAVAVKRIQCKSEDELQKALEDAMLLLEPGGHRNLLKYYGVHKDSEYVYLALDIYDRTLEQQITALELNAFTSLRILNQITEGLAYLHLNKMVHGNLNPGNILLCWYSQGYLEQSKKFGVSKKRAVCAKIADVGIGYPEPSKMSSAKFLQELDRWKSPELKTFNKMSGSCDIFSLGCIFYYVLSVGKHLFPTGDPNRKGFWKEDDSRKPKPRLVFGNLQLIKEMTAEAPKKRPKVDDILPHHIFWPKEKMLYFLVHVANIIATVKCPETKAIAKEIEKYYDQVVSPRTRHHLRTYRDWLTFMQMDVGEYRASYIKTASKHYKNKISGFLQLISNLKADYDKLPQYVRDVVGPLPNQFVDYWGRQFPLLVSMLWVVFQKLRNEEDVYELKNYYGNRHVFSF